MKTLIIEDEPRVADFLSQALQETGYQTTIARTGREGVNQLLSGEYSVAILDLMLPDMDGIQVLQQTRSSGNFTPILMLTARDTLDDRVEGLDAGADDYLGKPFELAELLARVRALLRRKPSERSHLNIDDLTLEPSSRRVTRGGVRIDLSAREYSLLEYLLRNRGRTVGRLQILQHVWEDPNTRDSNVVDVYINYLRTKIERPDRARLIHTVRGVGYVLELRQNDFA